MGVRPLYGLELCAGIGGLGLGISRVFPGYRTVVAAEIEAYCVAVLAQRQQDGALPPFPVWDDLTTFDGRPWRGVVDIVVAGYPCQPFSLAGKRLGENDPRHLWPHIARILGDVRPPLVFLENVAAHVGLGFEQVGEDLQRLGYRFQPIVLRTSDIGAPHQRKRLFVLAWARELVNAEGERRTEQPFIDDARRSLGRSEPGADGGTVDGRAASGVRDRCGIDPAGPTHLGELLADSQCAVRGADLHRGVNDRNGGDPGWSEALSASIGTGRDVVEADWPGFPPGPDDRDGWRRFLKQHPDFAPATERAVRRGADGASVRVDRLRALGNAVVPQQAEAALRLLWLRAFGE